VNQSLDPQLRTSYLSYAGYGMPWAMGLDLVKLVGWCNSNLHALNPIHFLSDYTTTILTFILLVTCWLN